MRPRIHAAGLALVADASLIVNVAHLHSTQDSNELLHLAMEHKGELFISVTLTRRETREVVRWLENSAAEVVGHVGGRRLRRLRRGG
ncbi:MAG: hypothetical protein ACRELB_00165 [Polyangiaceae bacterium]